MLRVLLTCLGLAALTGGLTLLTQAQEPGVKTGPESKGKPSPDGTKPAPVDANGKRIPLDKFKLPANAVIVLCDNVKDALQLFPRSFLVPSDQYKEMTDRLAALEKQLKPERKLPHTCKLHGTVKGDLLDLEVELFFKTDQPKTLVFLGCKGAQVKQALLKTVGEKDAGRIAALDYAADGYTLTADRAGRYHLTLRVELPLLAAGGGGGDRSFDLGLPGAAVTTLALDLAQPVKEIRWNKNVEKLPPGLKQKHWEATLGKLTQLVVAWKDQVTPPKGEPLITARGLVTVKVEEHKVTTVAELTLQDLHGVIKVWHLWLPEKATVKVTPPEGVTFRLQPPAKAEPVQTHTLQLDQATDDPIKVTITVTVPNPRNQPRIPVGPFGVIEAVRQEGSVEVRATPAARRGVRLNYLLHRDLEEREASKESGSETVASFRYTSMPIPDRKLTAPPTVVKSQAPLEIELKPNPGRVETHAEHTLRLRQTEQGWRVAATTRIHVRPQAAVDYLDVQLPRIPVESAALLGTPHQAFPGGVMWPALALIEALPLSAQWSLAGGGGAPEADLQYLETGGKKDGRVRIKFAKDQQSEFTMVLTGVYALPPGVWRTRLALPQPDVLRSRGGKVRAEVDDQWEWLVREGGLEMPAPQRQHFALEMEQAPAFVDLAWRPYRPEFPVQSVTDVTLRGSFAHVRQQLEFPGVAREPGGRPGSRPRQVQLRIPAGVHNLKAVGRDELTISLDPKRGRVAVVPLPAEGTGRLVLEYQFALPQPDQAKRPQEHANASLPFEVPLLWPEQATRTDTKVRLWCDANVTPTLTEQQIAAVVWQDQGTEIVAGADRLPRRVLAGTQTGAPLLLRLEVTPPDRDAVAERVLVQVAVEEDGSETYRVRFLLTELNAPTLRVKLPVPLAGQVQITLGQKRPVWELTDNGSVAKITVHPNLYHQPVILELTYQLARDHLHDEGVWRTGLHAPEFVGRVIVQQVRWQVSLPNSMVPLVVGENTGSPQQWVWRGWLLTPESALTSAQLEQWLTAPPSADLPVTPSLVLARDTLQPLYLVRVPQQFWFVLCSGLLLLLGLGLNSSALSSYTASLLMILVGLAVVLLGLFLPALLPVILYGCEPGAVVLIVVLLVQWTLQERYRRRVVFMPGFQRLKPGSSLVRTGSVHRPRDASTVDAPANPVAGSSVGKGN